MRILPESELDAKQKPETLEKAGAERSGEKKAKEGGFRERLGAPAKFLAEDFVKSVRVVTDKGGRVLVKDVVEIFGGTKKRELLGRTLAFATELKLLAKDGLYHSITEEGKAFLAANDDVKKTTLARLLAQFAPYRDVFIRLRDEKGRSLKKEIITQMWSKLAGGGGAKIRKEMTRTFASLSEYAGLVDDTGRTCVLQEETDSLLQGVTKARAPTPPPGGGGAQPPLLIGATPVAPGTFTCPKCNGSDIGVLDEEVVNYFRANNQTVVFVKYTFHCRSCKEKFSRHGQTSVAGELGSPHQDQARKAA